MRHVKLALGTMLAVFGLLGAVGSGWGFWSYWSDCHAPDPMLPLLRHPASYLSAKRQMCSNQLMGGIRQSGDGSVARRGRAAPRAPEIRFSASITLSPKNCGSVTKQVHDLRSFRMQPTYLGHEPACGKTDRAQSVEDGCIIW